MKEITITICTENAAFGISEREALLETAKILSNLANKLEYSDIPAMLRDTNGGIVGKVTME